MTAPVSAEIARLVALAEEGLRRLGFTERTIKERRKAIRAQMAAHFSNRTTDD